MKFIAKKKSLRSLSYQMEIQLLYIMQEPLLCTIYFVLFIVWICI